MDIYANESMKKKDIILRMTEAEIKTLWDICYRVANDKNFPNKNKQDKASKVLAKKLESELPIW